MALVVAPTPRASYVKGFFLFYKTIFGVNEQESPESRPNHGDGSRPSDSLWNRLSLSINSIKRSLPHLHGIPRKVRLCCCATSIFCSPSRSRPSGTASLFCCFFWFHKPQSEGNQWRTAEQCCYTGKSNQPITKRLVPIARLRHPPHQLWFVIDQKESQSMESQAPLQPAVVMNSSYGEHWIWYVRRFS